VVPAWWRRAPSPSQKAFELERRELLDNNRKEWEEAIQAHKAQEVRPMCCLESHNDRITESLRLEKTFQIIESYH